MHARDVAGWERALAILDIIPSAALYKLSKLKVLIKIGNTTIDVAKYARGARSVIGSASRAGWQFVVNSATDNRILDNVGTEIAKIINNVVTLKYAYFGGDIVAHQSKTTTLLGRFDVPNQGGTSKIIETDLYKVGANPGGFNVLKDSRIDDLINAGDIEGAWALNKDWLESAAKRGDVIKVVSDPLTGTNVFRDLTGVPSSVFDNPSNLADYLKNLPADKVDDLTFYGREIKWLSEKNYLINPSDYNFAK